MFYIPDIELAFNSVERIMRDVENGWLLRYMHSNGASFFFILIYLHVLRGIYIKSYVVSIFKLFVWYSGVIIFILSMAVAFMGYVLPWGQMSYWAATVITNLFTVIPIIGEKISYILWGSFSVSSNTLNRFYTIHFLLPFLIAILAVFHIILLHFDGSTNLFGIHYIKDYIMFNSYFVIKDIFSYLVYLLFFFIWHVSDQVS